MENIEDNEELKKFIEEMGIYFEQFGLSKMTGRIIGCLLLSEEEGQTFNNLMKLINASKGSISNSTRLLIHINLIEKVGKPGEKISYYKIRDDAWLKVLFSRTLYLKPIRELSENIIKLLKQKNSIINPRLEEMKDMYEFFEKEFPSLLEKWVEYRNNKYKPEDNG